MPVAKAELDLARCDALVSRALSGDAGARRELVEHLWPVWQRMVRGSRSMGPLARSDDDVGDVVGALVEKFSVAEGRLLEIQVEWRVRHPKKTFADWLRIVTTNAVRDHMRARFGRDQTADDGHPLPSVKRMLNELSAALPLDAVGVRPPLTAAQTARKILEYAKDHLAEDQHHALGSWLGGATFEEIQEELGLADAESGRKLVRAAIAVLRREFATEADPGT